MSLGNIFVNSFATVDSLVNILLGHGNAPCFSIPKAEAISLLSSRKYAGCKYVYTHCSMDVIPAVGIVVATAMFKLNKERNNFSVSQRDAAEQIVFGDVVSEHPYTFMSGGLIDDENPDFGKSLIINPDEVFLVKFDLDSEYGISDDIIHKEPRTPEECSKHIQPPERFIVIPHEYTKSAQVNVVGELESIRIATAQALAKALPNFNGLGQIVLVGLATGFTYSKETLKNGLATPLHGIKSPVWSIYARPWTIPIGSIWGKCTASRKSLANVLLLNGGALPKRTTEQRLTNSVVTQTLSLGETFMNMNVSGNASSVVESDNIVEVELPPVPNTNSKIPAPPVPTPLNGTLNEHFEAQEGKETETTPIIPNPPSSSNDTPPVPQNTGVPPKRERKYARGAQHTISTAVPTATNKSINVPTVPPTVSTVGDGLAQLIEGDGSAPITEDDLFED